MKRTLLIFPFLFLLMSQSAEWKKVNQDKPARKAIVENFFEHPFQLIQNFFARQTYEKYERDTLDPESESNRSREVKCSMDGSPLPESVLGDLTAIPHIACQCEPWGNCVKAACECRTLCPKNFNIFKRKNLMPLQELSKPENSFAFRNFGKDGVCWGHASLSQKFNRLAFFRPDVVPPFRLHTEDQEERARALKYYKDIIDDIAENRPVDIPGYSDLRTFSDDPELSNYIMDRVMNEWADRAMSWQGLRIGLQEQPKSKEHNEKIFAEARRRLALNQQVNLVFTHNKETFNTHSLLVSHESVKEGRPVLCLRDSNFMRDYNYRCENYMFIGEDGAISWRDADNDVETVGGIDVAHNDDRDAVKQVKNLHKKCEKEKGCR